MQKIIANDPESKSLDITVENVARLREFFPEAFSEKRIDFDALKQMLGGAVEDREEKYGLNWPGKRKARLSALTPSGGTLLPCKKQSRNWEGTRNLIIQGDNLEVLKLLQKSYHGQIKAIYIDPPYNTGSDFIYPDDFAESLSTYLQYTGQVDADGKKFSTNTEASGRFHSRWLSMMWPRLFLARNLLRDDGVIFVSIDDHEVHNLRMLMNEVFGEENFISCIANVNNPKGRSDDKYVATAHEYLLLYKKKEPVLYGWEPEDNILNRFNKTDESGRLYREIDLRKTGDGDRREDRPNLFYYFLYNKETNDFYPTRDEKIPKGYVQICPLKEDGSHGRWRWELDTANAKLKTIFPKLMPKRQVWSVFEMDYLSDDEREKPTSAWTKKEFNSERGSEQFIALGFDKSVFPRPKPLGLLRRILEFVTRGDNDDIILDFFAGSGTTGQAVLEANAADNGNRRFILVQLPEEIENGQFKSILDICTERVTRAAQQVTNTAIDSGFRLFKLDASNIKAWEPDRSNLEQSLLDSIEHINPNREESDVLFELLLKLGLELTTPIEQKSISGKTVYSIGFGVLIVCLSKEIASKDVEGLAQGIIGWHKELAPVGETTCVFRDSAFANDVAKTNFSTILSQNGLENVRSL